MKFEEMPLFFFTKHIYDEAVPQHMKDYMERTGKKRGEGKSCCCMLHYYSGM